LDALKATICHKYEANPSATTSETSDMYASSIIDGQVRISGSNDYLKSLLIQMGTKCQVSNITEDENFQV
jgi:hypothetical protein